MEDQSLELIDLLASEYGWKIEYIQSLDTDEIYDLAKQIKLRKIDELKMLSLTIVAAINGKTLDMLLKNINNQRNKTKETKREEADMVKLFNLLGNNPKQLQEGLKKGKLKA